MGAMLITAVRYTVLAPENNVAQRTGTAY
ncbi:hypothetical protein CITRIK5_30449 [Citricoccus sp. K5]|nr:hypothetical protein CITRIK5_30449 [Citricoccus sp. K5]